MLAGTLVTIAGFIPVGFAASSARRIPFSLFAVVSIALIGVVVRCGDLRAAAGCRHSQATEGRGDAEPGRIFRLVSGTSSLSPCGRKWLTIFVFAGALRRHPFSRFRSSLSNSFRPRIVPSCWSTSACRRMRRSMPAKPRAQRLDAALEGRSGCLALEHLCGSRRHSLLSAAQCSDCRTTSSPRRSLLQRTLRHANVFVRSLEKSPVRRVSERNIAGLPA